MTLYVLQKLANPDQMIIRYYKRQFLKNRILVTLDEHFGDWVILPLSQHPDVIRLKVSHTASEEVLELLLPFLHSHSSGQFKNRLVITITKTSKMGVNRVVAIYALKKLDPINCSICSYVDNQHITYLINSISSL
jgi:predicted nuclease of predicted toxin-antitoxin system